MEIGIRRTPLAEFQKSIMKTHTTLYHVTRGPSGKKFTICGFVAATKLLIYQWPMKNTVSPRDQPNEKFFYKVPKHFGMNTYFHHFAICLFAVSVGKEKEWGYFSVKVDVAAPTPNIDRLLVALDMDAHQWLDVSTRRSDCESHYLQST
ncbi:hypothetical protein CBL_08714 [Carabus blaptoides fortunei]